MKFEFIKEVSGEVPGYGGQSVKTGDIVDLDGHLASKAKGNPDYREPKEDEPIATENTKKRMGRPPKVSNGDQG